MEEIMLSLGHKNLDVWQQSKRLVVHIYKLTKNFPSHEMYTLISQIRRAAISIPSNIAEGASRSNTKDRRRFYEIARSSLVELDTQIEIAIDLDYCNADDIREIEKEINQLFSRLSTLITKTK